MKLTMPGPRALALLIPLLWLVVLGSAAGAIYVKHRARELFVELEKVNRERDRLEIALGDSSHQRQRFAVCLAPIV